MSNVEEPTGEQTPLDREPPFNANDAAQPPDEERFLGWRLTIFGAFVSILAISALILPFLILKYGDITNIAYARGMVTVLISYGTLAVALILVLGVLIGGQNLKAAQARFRSAKDVLTVLVGILGTIIGYYFGTQADGSPTPPAIGGVIASDLKPKAKEEFTVTVFWQGGKAPFRYSIDFDDEKDEIQDIENQETPLRQIEADVSLENVKTTKDVGITVTVTDAQDDTAIFTRPRGKWVQVQASSFE